MDFTRVRGTRDFLPEDEIPRQQIIETIRETYEEFGFSPLDTPALETSEVLLAKSESIRDEIYIFKDKAGREIGLRFDHTVPLARVVAENPQLPLPFRRYAIGKVWRYDRPQSGRYREFTQADVDIVGSKDVIADFEVVWAGTTALKRIGVPPFEVLYNSRRLIDAWGESIGLTRRSLVEFVRTVDKWFKIGEEGVREELRNKGLEGFLDGFKDLFVDVSELPESTEALRSAKEELVRFTEYLEEARIPSRFDPRMVRGLDYYTGIVFETYVKDRVNWGSIGSGGRYDELIKLLSGREVPATGYSIGVDRLFSLLKEEGIVKPRKTVTKVYVAPVGNVSRSYVLKVVEELRSSGIPTEFDVMGRKLRKQLEYADSLEIPIVIVVGAKEEAENIVKLKDMRNGEERAVKLAELVDAMSHLL